MRRIILSVCLCISVVIAFAQLSITGNHMFLGEKNGRDSITVIIFDSITSNTVINYTGTNVKFYKFADAGTNANYITTLFPPDDATGYVIDVDGIRKDSIWVISYKNYMPIANSLTINNIQSNLCSETNLNFILPELFYKTLDNQTHTIPRNCNINYNTLKWNGAAWETRDTTLLKTLPPAQLTVPVPYCTTTFTVSGDQYAKTLQIDTFKISSVSYTPVAVISHLTTNVSSRQHDKNNEAIAPSHALPISFSAPIDVQFLSNGNEPITQFYKWEIYKDTKFLISRTDKDQRYTFTEAGTYKVKLTVSNATCSFSDSITVIVSESALYVPDVFTPNGDGFNDEFRVAYKSLISFQCWVYNRWGRQVFYWNDPTKGWDGNINGKKAVPGPYFYVIKATGSDKKVYKLKGDINLLRGN